MFSSISIIAPVNNENNIVGRILNSIVYVDYPSDKKEIIIIEDGNRDNTAQIGQKFASDYPSQVKLLARYVSTGKPSALQEVIKHVTWEIVRVFDVDNIPESDFLLDTVNYFDDSSVVAVQGKLVAISEAENILTKFVVREEGLRCGAYFIWWNQDIDWHNLYVKEDWVSVYDSGRISQFIKLVVVIN